MSLLKRKNHDQVLLTELCVAKSFTERLQGLLGAARLTENQGLFIHKCRSVHTCFMSFPIDCIFVNDQLEIQSLVRNLKPWRMSHISWNATSVIEVAAGQIDQMNLKVGEVLDVGN